MTKLDLLSDSCGDLFNDPIGFLKSFILLLVPSGYVMWILIAGHYAENSGHGIIGGLLLFGYNIIDKIYLFIFEMLIDLVVYAVVAVVVITAFLEALGIKK